jgi:V8-like Glu-specific endopeptidase
MKYLLILSTLISLNTYAVVYENGLIYGEDNRYEASDYPDESYQKISESVALRVPNRRLTPRLDNPNIIDFYKERLNEMLPNLCMEERYAEQFHLGDCSGFLIAKNKLLTAGHCMFSENDCKDNSWVFSFNETSENFDTNSIYHCKKIIAQSFKYEANKISDYAIIELDRETDREPLKYRKSGHPFPGTKLLIIGHPLGLPKKIADNAQIKYLNSEERQHPFKSIILRKSYFIANLDSYAGNSGSPVFNLKTKEVEGILVQGADDFSFNETKSCLESNRLSNSSKTSFEKVFRITQIPEL